MVVHSENRIGDWDTSFVLYIWFLGKLGWWLDMGESDLIGILIDTQGSWKVKLKKKNGILSLVTWLCYLNFRRNGFGFNSNDLQYMYFFNWIYFSLAFKDFMVNLTQTDMLDVHHTSVKCIAQHFRRVKNYIITTVLLLRYKFKSDST